MTTLHSSQNSFICSQCKETFTYKAKHAIQFCPFCGHNPLSSKDLPNDICDNYQLLNKIGKGGMGEVYLAYDEICGRKIALKRIRSDLTNHLPIQNRFLKEAHITCQLMHPSIIPIYSIQTKNASTYYTMPFVEGETLKEIIKKSRKINKKGEKQDQLGGSIPALMRIFLSICQAIAYAHAKKIIHRDLKLENVIIGKYGEVLLLDWGLAKFIDEPNDDASYGNIQSDQHTRAQITKIGKVVGTVSYMAPERAQGHPATIQTDVYSLGVILYQLLTLKNPFRRGTLQEFRKSMKKEELQDPVLVAPYRDVPYNLARIAQKCLSVDLNERCQTVEEIIHEIQNYLEGRSDWFPIAEIDLNRKSDWEFQENILIANHAAVALVTEEAEWVNLMISQQSFAGNIRVETSVCFDDNTQGIGILISIPEAIERTYINDGYCLWLGSDEFCNTRLLRSNVEVMQAPDIFLKRGKTTKVRIEKIDRSIHLYLDDILQFSYIAQIPLVGTHIGLLMRDKNFTLNSLTISLSSLSLTVNCLAVPDAFLAHRDFSQALSEYRRIANSFPDRAEGREALFRAGLTFIEQSKNSDNKIAFLDLALEEFEKLHGTPGGPLEYLGKSLVYQDLNENVEEIKCFEIAYRRYPHHPLLSILNEQVLSRMHEVSREQRITTYRFILLTVRHFSPQFIDTHTKRLFTSLQRHWEILPFIEESHSKTYQQQLLSFAIPLSFWLAQTYTLGEIIQQLITSENPCTIEINNALTCLIELGEWKYARATLEMIKEENPTLPSTAWIEIEKMLACHENDLDNTFSVLFPSSITKLTFPEKRTCLHAINQALKQKRTDLVYFALGKLEHCELTFEDQLQFNCRRIVAQLFDKNWQQVGELLYAYPIELLNKNTTPLHFLYGCWLRQTENEEIAHIHFSGLIPSSYPRTWMLASYEISGEFCLDTWIDKAFEWEKKELYRQLALYYDCAQNEKKRDYYNQLSLETINYKNNI